MTSSEDSVDTSPELTMQEEAHGPSIEYIIPKRLSPISCWNSHGGDINEFVEAFCRVNRERNDHIDEEIVRAYFNGQLLNRHESGEEFHAIISQVSP